jgi:hypothetical protein
MGGLASLAQGFREGGLTRRPRERFAASVIVSVIALEKSANGGDWTNPTQESESAKSAGRDVLGR